MPSFVKQVPDWLLSSLAGFLATTFLLLEYGSG
jgi:hypothetical protein